MHRRFRTDAVCSVAALLTAVLLSEARAADDGPSFQRDIRPILADKCFACHGPDALAREADLRLDQRDAAVSALASGEGRAIAPGSRLESAVWQRIVSADPDLRMPPSDSGKELSEAEREQLGEWIDAGAPYQAHWAYVPLSRPDAPPAAAAGDWRRNAIDDFVLAELGELQLQPSPSADQRTLIRRLCFDLTGLPPAPEQYQRYLELLQSQAESDGYEQIVDDLLASARYGERMAAYWLDLVRYADTVGYHGDQEISVSPFRDYVIRAFNANMPFDQFSREQLAGDLFKLPSIEHRVASGYNRLGMMSAEGGVQPKEYLAKYAAERVRNASVVWLASTMGCAECHNHKFDPFTQTDFYSFAAFFADIKEKGLYDGASRDGDFGPRIAVPTLEQATQMERLKILIRKQKREFAAIADPTPEQAEDHQTKLKSLREQKEQIEEALVTAHVVVAVKPRTMRVLPRGNWMDDSGPIVEPATPHFLPPLVAPGRASRLDLANWLFEPDNPLTARVFVNRIWRLLFGRGIVATLDDFGVQGNEPTHPELLDFLAVEFRDSGWNVKRLVKSIVMSATYRQDSNATDEWVRRDPYNRLLARQGRFRLDAEMVRDNALAASGLLVHQLGGPSVRPYQPAGYYKHLNFPVREYQHDSGDSLWRRTVYTHWQRQFLHPSLLMFDAPSREECTVDRPRSNTPLAALVMLNDPIYVEAARGLAERMLVDGGDDWSERVQLGMQRTLNRRATVDELVVLADVYQTYRDELDDSPDEVDRFNHVGTRPTPKGADPAELAAMTGVARVILNLHESITRY